MKIRTATGLLAWLMRRAGFLGWTSFWHVVYVLPGHEQNERLLLHERCHLEQIERDGRLLFSIKHLWWLARHGYRKPPYEVEARAAEHGRPQNHIHHLRPDGHGAGRGHKRADARLAASGPTHHGNLLTMQDTAHQTAEAIAQATSDAAMAKFGLGVGVSGGSTMVLSGLTLNAFGVIFGMVIGLAGLLVQWYYKHRMTTVEIRLREEAAARDAEEHRARMGMY